FVPRHERVEAVPQRDQIERAAQTHGGPQVIERAVGLELVEQPQPLLRKRQRKRIEFVPRLLDQQLQQGTFISGQLITWSNTIIHYQSPRHINIDIAAEPEQLLQALTCSAITRRYGVQAQRYAAKSCDTKHRCKRAAKPLDLLVRVVIVNRGADKIRHTAR